MISQFIIRLLKYFLLVFIGLNIVAIYFDYCYRGSKIFKPMVIYNDSFDHVAIGSSRSLTGLRSDKLQSELGAKWFNLSMDDTPIETHLLELKLLLAFGKNPQFILLQYDRLGVDDRSQELLDRDYQFLPLSYFDHGVLWEYIKNRGNGKGLLLYLLPCFKYIYYNTELLFPILKYLTIGDFRYRSNELGDYFYPNNLQFKGVKSNVRLESLNAKDSKFLEFKKLCRVNKIDSKVYTAPFFSVKVDSDLNDYLNYSNLLKQDSSYFVDDLHLNKSGVEVLTNQLIKDLKRR